MDAEAEEPGGSQSVVDEVAAAICEAAPLELPGLLCLAFRRAMGADGVALTLASHTHHWELLHATGPVAEHGEEAQFALGDGPTITASACSRPVLVPDLRTSSWPLHTQLAASVPGVRTVLALPVSLRQVHFGAISLYYSRPQALSEREAEYAQCAAYLAVAPLTGAQEELSVTGDGWPTSTSWAPVRLAVGMISSLLGRPTADALDLLRAHSFTLGRPLQDVAAALLDAHRRRGDSNDDPDWWAPA
jgi:GAF domain-containing protein